MDDANAGGRASGGAGWIEPNGEDDGAILGYLGDDKVTEGLDGVGGDGNCAGGELGDEVVRGGVAERVETLL